MKVIVLAAVGLCLAVFAFSAACAEESSSESGSGGSGSGFGSLPFNSGTFEKCMSACSAGNFQGSGSGFPGGEYFKPETINQYIPKYPGSGGSK